ncbi:MAG: DUF2306 domain-containing protein [Deltaproteobacteria bacterium]|nr:DUF2306 domain-containing protein [Deltaproteobacteria bacterium]
MTATALLRNAREPSNAPSASAAAKALRAAGALWFAAAVIGQWAFAVYVASFYGGAAISRRFERWNEVLVGGYVPGGVIGNVALGAHLLLALVITIGGPLQLVPQLRVRAPGAHRWNGRVYVATALLITLSGLYAVWTRGTAGGASMRVGISLNGVLILVCASLAWRRARAGAIASHRRWALRTFMLVSGVWFFRIGLMLWILVHGGPVGVGDDFDGPFVRAWAFGCYLFPLLLLQGFLWAEARPVARDKYLVAALLACVALATAVGIAGALLGMWLPRM